MKAYKVYKITFTLYLIACIVAEIWFLVTLHKIKDYKEYGVESTDRFTIYTDSFYFLENILLIIITLIYINEKEGLFKYIWWYFITRIGFYGFVVMRLTLPSSYLGEIPFNCNFNHYLPENVKIACKARLLSCTLDFSSYALPFLPFLVNGLNYLFSKSKSIHVVNVAYNNLQKNLFVL
ncbi:hypothetical protein C1645_826257 [Glomus cerebriforme]|uniref:Uncharacterized protein n=1 Tax=Glomus cerebriforme TaxID=658196 RepID=A0A397T048_9GLOM|nr:hypothetical protein C1645_826257 [Glomus cerebriforme]